MAAPRRAEEACIQAYEAWIRHGRSRMRAATELGIPIPTLKSRLDDYNARFATNAELRQQAQHGDIPPGVAVPDGLVLKGTSELLDADGNRQKLWNKTKIEGRDPNEAVQLPDPKKITKVSTFYDQQGRVTAQWVAEKPEDQQREQRILQAVREFVSNIPNIDTPSPPPMFDRDVVPWFQIGDAHIGMLAHEAETGANFDLKIAERELCAAFAILIDESPPRERCVINDLGDATHYENMSATTEASGHQLDADGRFPKMISVYARIMRFIVDRALARFANVDVIINQGNHSRTNDVWMAELIRAVYEHTGRVNVLNNSSVFIPYRMGNTFVMVHHGDKTKPDRLVQVMCHDFRHDWGETEYHYIDVGHLHHKWAAREVGCVIEMWNTLAPRDKWATDAGFRSLQSITRVDRSKDYGEVGRRVLPIREIRDVVRRAHGDAVYMPPPRKIVFSI